jgi:hypothetical protein
MRSPAMSALSPLEQHKRTKCGRREIDAIDPRADMRGSGFFRACAEVRLGRRFRGSAWSTSPLMRVTSMRRRAEIRSD